MATVLEKHKTQLPTQTMTYEEFLDWADEDTYAEWVDGKVEMMSPASEKHQDISDFLAAILRVCVEDFDSGRVLSAPFQMRLSNVRRGREPDLLFVRKENIIRLQRSYLDGPADLAIEIVSPESVLRDRGAKYAEYEAGGVREYWIIDADALTSLSWTAKAGISGRRRMRMADTQARSFRDFGSTSAGCGRRRCLPCGRR